MLISANYQQNQNFGSISRMQLMVKNTSSPTKKQLNSAANNLINVLMKRDTAELRQPGLMARNDGIRRGFAFMDLDYRIPEHYKSASRSILKNPLFQIRRIFQFEGGQPIMYIFTGKDARNLDVASDKIKEANKLGHAKEKARAKKDYAYAISDIFDEAKDRVSSFVLSGKKEKSGKITPIDISNLDFGA